MLGEREQIVKSQRAHEPVDFLFWLLARTLHDEALPRKLLRDGFHRLWNGLFKALRDFFRGEP